MNTKILSILAVFMLLGGLTFAQSENANENAKGQKMDSGNAEFLAEQMNSDDETSEQDETDSLDETDSENETDSQDETDSEDDSDSKSNGKSKEAKEKVNRGRIISQIASTTGGDKAGKMSDVVRFVKEAMKNPELRENETQEEFIAQIKLEAFELIYSAINESDNVSLGNTTGVIDEINITSDNVSLDNSTVNASGKDITVETDDGNVTVSQEEDGVEISDSGNTSVMADAISISNGSLVYKGEEIKLPSTIRAKIKANVQSMELTQERGEVAYKAKTKTKTKFIGLFDVEYDGETLVDAQSGDEISSNAPWWAFMAFN